MDSAALRPLTNPSKPCRRASRRVVEQHSHRRDDQYYAVGMCELVGPWTVARHWLASLVSRTRQLDGDSAEPIKAVQPLGRGQGSGIRGCLAGKKGAARETSNIYHQGGITKLEQNRANCQKQPVETYDLLTCLPPPICKDQMETTPPCAISPHPPQPHRILGTRRRSPLISASASHPQNPGQHWDWASRYAESPPAQAVGIAAGGLSSGDGVATLLAQVRKICRRGTTGLDEGHSRPVCISPFGSNMTLFRPTSPCLCHASAMLCPALPCLPAILRSPAAPCAAPQTKRDGPGRPKALGAPSPRPFFGREPPSLRPSDDSGHGSALGKLGIRS